MPASPTSLKWPTRPCRTAALAVALSASVAAVAEPPAGSGLAVDPAARLLAGSGAGEAWDISAQLGGGAYFFVRFWITNEGPGSHTGVAMGYFLGADGRVAQFRYGRTRDRWELGAGGRFLKVASAVLDLRAPSGSVEIDTNRGGMKIYLRFAMPEAPAAACARRDGDAGFDVLRLQEDVDGIAWVAGMAAPIAARGVVDVTHSWGASSEIDTLLRRVDVSGRDGALAFFATAVAAPGELDRPTSCVVVADTGTPTFESRDAALEIGPTLAGTDAGYPLPGRIALRGPQVTLTADTGRELLRVNPLDIVPQPFRTLLALRSAPRRAWADTRWRLRLQPAGGTEAVDHSGVGVAAVTYTNPP